MMLAVLTSLGALFAQARNADVAAGGLFLFCLLFFLALMVLPVLIGQLRIFTKAGEPAWAALIPIYNGFVLCRIVGRPEIWGLLLLIPFVNIVIGIIVTIELAKAFGKGTGFAIGLLFLPYIFIPILGLGSAEYLGPEGKRKKRRRLNIDDDYDRPAPRPRRRDDDDRYRRPRDEVEEDRPRRRRRAVEDEDED